MTLPVTDQSSRTAAAAAARRVSTQAMLERVATALAQLSREQSGITVSAVSRRANVSRTFLYQNPNARDLMGNVRETVRAPSVVEALGVGASWQERALNAEAEIKRTYAEIRTQRERLAELYGHIRELERDLPPDGTQAVLAENYALKRRAQQLHQEVRRLEERLTSARDNNRFLDKRLALLEMQILEAVQS